MLPSFNYICNDYDGLIEKIPELSSLDSTIQDPIYHAEGTAGIHTRMVLSELVNLESFKLLSHKSKNIVWWAALFHDIGKIWTTGIDDNGRVISPYHSKVGAVKAFEILWNWGIDWHDRIQIYGLVKHHMKPNFWIERNNLLKSTILLAEEVNLKNLLVLAWADSKGRKSLVENNDYQTTLHLCELAFEESGCLTTPYKFNNSNSRVEYATISDRYHGYTAREPTGSKVIVMWGLPGSGKDYWLNKNNIILPVISLDDIRQELNINYNNNQGLVIQTAIERARVYLRKKEDFIWNSTNINFETRSKILNLIHNYNGYSEIVVIDTPPTISYNRNINRKNHNVPKNVFLNMLRKLTPPAAWECHNIRIVTDLPELVTQQNKIKL